MERSTWQEECGLVTRDYETPHKWDLVPHVVCATLCLALGDGPGGVFFPKLFQ